MTMEQMNFVEMDQMFFSGKKDVANGDGAKFLLEVENNLLGSFSLGKYHIDEKLCEQLVKLTKVYLYAFGDKVFCESFAKFKRLGKLQFVINVEEQDKEQIATLCLLQDIKDGDKKKTAMTSLSTFKALKSPAFFSDCFAKFNVFSKDDGGLADRDKREDLSALLAREKYINCANQVLDASEQDFEALFNQKVELLQKYGVGKEILKELEAEVAKQGGASKFGHAKHRYLNRLLDRIIQKNMPEILSETMLSMQLTKLNNDFFENLSKKIEQKTANGEQVVETIKVAKSTLGKAQSNSAVEQSKPKAEKATKSSSGSASGQNKSKKENPHKKTAPASKSPEKQPQPSAQRHVASTKKDVQSGTKTAGKILNNKGTRDDKLGKINQQQKGPLEAMRFFLHENYSEKKPNVPGKTKDADEENETSIKVGKSISALNQKPINQPNKESISHQSNKNPIKQENGEALLESM